jgi:MFS family permease
MVAFVVPLILMPFSPRFWPMLVCIAIGGYTNAILNVLIQSVLQLGVPSAMRGKVFGLLDTMTQGLTPIGLALGGVLGELLPIRFVIGGAFLLIAAFIFPQLGSRSLRDFFAIQQTDHP